MSVGLGFLNKALEDNLPIASFTGDLVTVDLFQDDEVDAYNMILEHYAQYGRLPNVKTVEREVDVKLSRRFPDEPIGYWVDALQNRKRSSIILSATKELHKLIKSGDVDEAQEKLKDAVIELERRSPTDRIQLFTDVLDSVVRAHDTKQQTREMLGVPFGMPYLDIISDGAQASDTVALVGRPGLGKSYMLLRMALHAFDAMHKPLVVSLEMPTIQCVRRLIALKSHVTATTIRLGRLSHYAKRKLISHIEELKTDGREFYIIEGTLATTIEDLVLRIQEIKPNALYVDGAYLLQTREKHSSRWERVAATAEMMKNIAHEFRVPVIATYQFNRRGAGGLGNIGYSDSIGQLASIVISIVDEPRPRDSNSWAPRQYKILELLKGREGEKGRIRVLYDMQRMIIEQDSVLSGYLSSGEEE